MPHLECHRKQALLFRRKWNTSCPIRFALETDEEWGLKETVPSSWSGLLWVENGLNSSVSVNGEFAIPEFTADGAARRMRAI